MILKIYLIFLESPRVCHEKLYDAYTKDESGLPIIEDPLPEHFPKCNKKGFFKKQQMNENGETFCVKKKDWVIVDC